MPLVRIDISKTASRKRVPDVGNAVYNAIIAVANVPENDRFQVITRHEPDEIIYRKGLPRHRLDAGRSTELKKFISTTDEIHAKQGVRKQAYLDQPGRFRRRTETCWLLSVGQPVTVGRLVTVGSIMKFAIVQS